MKQWWERNSGIVREDYTKDEIEDFTGCIPLLLESCIVDGKMDLHVNAMKSVWGQVAQFISKTRKNAIGESWEEYVTVLEI
jgi:hypothetical protein